MWRRLESIPLAGDAQITNRNMLDSGANIQDGDSNIPVI
jgi:hypothetical protein